MAEKDDYGWLVVRQFEEVVGWGWVADFGHGGDVSGGGRFEGLEFFEEVVFEFCGHGCGGLYVWWLVT